MKVLLDLDVSDKRVFLRADLDVPLEKTQVFESATRLHNLKDTVGYLLEHDVSQIVIAGHIDRPEKPDPSLSTEQLLEPLKKILSTDIIFKENFESNVDGRVVLLENLRFWPGEIANDQNFAQKLANLADVYVNEAFGNSHRVHASMISLPKLLPHAAGFHLTWEIEELTKILKNPTRPFVAIVGGAKIETKIPVIGNLAKIADTVLVGGEIAKEIQNSKFKIQNYNPKVKIAQINETGKDINNESINQFKAVIGKAKTVVWNGPLGVFEEGFGIGTLAIAQTIVESGAYSIVGGGETTQFLAQNNLFSKFSFVSSGGGAMLEFLAGKKLPGIKALE